MIRLFKFNNKSIYDMINELKLLYRVRKRDFIIKVNKSIKKKR